jgi:predicted transposase YbfD/YdcC
VHETFEKSRGRLERRTLTSTTVLNDYLDWPDVGQVCQIVRETTRNGQKTIDVQYALSSVGRDQAGAKRLLNWWRGQWKIENGLHWVRDVTLCEDASRIRTGDAPQNLAAMRNAIISCFRIEKIPNTAATLREYAWKPQRLFAKLGRWIN